MSSSTFSTDVSLIFAAQTQNLPVLRELLRAADPKTAGSLALVVAVRVNWMEGVDLLLPVSDPSARGNEALLTAIEYGSVEMVRRLIPHSTFTAKSTFLQEVRKRENRAEILALLLPHVVNQNDKDDALLYAAVNKDLESVDVLWPVADTGKVLADLRRRVPQREEDWADLEWRAVDKQRTVLQNAIDHPSSLPTVARKI